MNGNLIPERIISLTPSLTETLFALGLEKRLVGVTDTCDYPEAAREKPNVACWFDPDMERLRGLEPDLVIGAASAHQELEATLATEGIEVALVDPASIEDVLDLIEGLGSRLGVRENAENLVRALRKRLSDLDEKVGGIPEQGRLTACRVLEWDEGKVYVAGPRSFQYDVIARAGAGNVTGGFDEAYPRIRVEELRELNPEAIFFCGYPKEFMLKVLSESSPTFDAVATGRLFRFDCNFTCRSGPRIVDMAEMLHASLYGR